jgi:hypothetical protein
MTREPATKIQHIIIVVTHKVKGSNAGSHDCCSGEEVDSGRTSGAKVVFVIRKTFGYSMRYHMQKYLP